MQQMVKAVDERVQQGSKEHLTIQTNQAYLKLDRIDLHQMCRISRTIWL